MGKWTYSGLAVISCLLLPLCARADDDDPALHDFVHGDVISLTPPVTQQLRNTTCDMRDYTQGSTVGLHRLPITFSLARRVNITEDNPIACSFQIAVNGRPLSIGLLDTDGPTTPAAPNAWAHQFFWTSAYLIGAKPRALLLTQDGWGGGNASIREFFLVTELKGELEVAARGGGIDLHVSGNKLSVDVPYLAPGDCGGCASTERVDYVFDPMAGTVTAKGLTAHAAAAIKFMRLNATPAGQAELRAEWDRANKRKLQASRLQEATRRYSEVAGASCGGALEAAKIDPDIKLDVMVVLATGYKALLPEAHGSEPVDEAYINSVDTRVWDRLLTRARAECLLHPEFSWEQTVGLAITSG